MGFMQGLRTADPLGLACRRGNLAVQAHGCLQCHEGTACGHPLQENLIQLPCLLLQHSGIYLDSCLLQDGNALACHLGIGIRHCHDHPADTGFHQCPGTGTRPAVVGTRLQGHIYRSTLGKLPCHIEGMNLRMGSTGLPMPALSHDAAVLYHHGSHHRVGRGAALGMGSQLNGPCHHLLIKFFLHPITSDTNI